MDETTPHIHATIVPIVRGERRKAKQEEQVASEKKRYRKKDPDRTRLCADDVITRQKLKHYHDTYAEAMKGYGLLRGVERSETVRLTSAEFYREMFLKRHEIEQEVTSLRNVYDELYNEISELDKHKNKTDKELKETKIQLAETSEELVQIQEELVQTKKNVKSEQLKSKAVDTGLMVVEKVGALFHDKKGKIYEQRIIELENYNKELITDIDKLKQEFEELNRNWLSREQILLAEKALLKQNLSSIHSYFPFLDNSFSLWHNFFSGIGFQEQDIREIFKMNPLKMNGRLYSNEFCRWFEVHNCEIRLSVNSKDNNRLDFYIDGKDHVEWFREQYHNDGRNLEIDWDNMIKVVNNKKGKGI